MATMSDKPNLITTAKVQQMLEENFEYIKTIQRRQEEGQAEECMQWQKKLQENLTFLAKIADAQPAHQAPAPQYGGHPGAMHPAALLRPQQPTYAAHPGYAHTSAPAYAPQPTAAPAQQYPGTAAHSAQQQARQFATPLAHAGTGAAPSYYTPLSQPPSAPAYGYTQPTAAAAQPGGAAWLGQSQPPASQAARMHQ